jgi:hypothetical protein
VNILYQNPGAAVGGVEPEDELIVLVDGETIFQGLPAGAGEDAGIKRLGFRDKGGFSFVHIKFVGKNSLNLEGLSLNLK